VNDIKRMGVVGASLMGSGIAEVCARSGLDVLVAEVNPDALQAGRQRITASLDRALRSGKLTEADRDTALERLTFSTDMDDFADRELVVEAVAEGERIKTDIFAALDKTVTAPDAILASNTSSIPIMKLAMATQRPAQVIGVHFFNPVPVLKLVEIIPSHLTGAETQARAEAFASLQLGKTVVHSPTAQASW
jgi:3-hydroxybutyryl-CoA dehydrogenase